MLRKGEVHIKQQAVWLGTICKNTDFGVYRSSADFVTRAKEFMHPFDTCHSMPELMVSALKFVLTSGPVVVLNRLETLCLWRSWAQELEIEEKSLHATLFPGVEKVVANKRILLMERIADQIGWEDKQSFSCSKKGFSLTGNQEKMGIFPDDFKPPTCGVDELMDRAKFVKPALWGKIRNEAVQSFFKSFEGLARPT